MCDGARWRTDTPEYRPTGLDIDFTYSGLCASDAKHRDFDESAGGKRQFAEAILHFVGESLDRAHIHRFREAAEHAKSLNILFYV